MPTYYVYIIETLSNRFTIEAPNSDEAERIAERGFDEGTLLPDDPPHRGVERLDIQTESEEVKP